MKRKKDSFLRYASQYRSNWVLALLLTGSVFVASLQHHSGSVHTSILNLDKVPAFDGTVYPIQKNADWARLKSDEYKMSYEELLERGKIIDQPACDLELMNIPNDTLGWSNEKDILIRNTKISCTVRFAGSYEGAGNYVAQDDDMDRFVGTHPAQDIKAPSGTPIHAVAHGVVSVVGYQSGWGNYMVIAHPNVPSPKNTKKKVTLYTGYAHMLEMPDYEVGDIVKKNTVIGKVGSTGFSTTPHVHFQLDLDEAPFHLYWPFNTSEQKAKGLSFVEAVDQDLGWDNMMAYNADPMAWVEKHLKTTSSASNEKSKDKTKDKLKDQKESKTTQSDDELEVKEEPSNNGIEEEESEPLANSEEAELEPASESSVFHRISVDGPNIMMKEQKKIFTVELLDADKNPIKDVQLREALRVGINSEVLQSKPEYLNASDFKNGQAEIEVYAIKTGESDLYFKSGNRTWDGLAVQVLDKIEPFASFKWVHDGEFVKDLEEKMIIQAVDLEGRVTPSFNGKNDILISVAEGKAKIDKNILTRKDFSKGYTEIKVTPLTDEPLKLKLSYGKLEIYSQTIEKGIFSDFSEDDPFYDSVLYLYKKGSIQGYPDKSYRPQASVNRAESLKLIYKALDLSTKSKKKARFSDFEGDEWFADILHKAFEDGVIKGYPDGSVRPARTVNRVEFLKMLIQASQLELPQDIDKNLFKDVQGDEWFAPYVQFAQNTNIFPNENQDYFYPNQELSRGEIAEALYRVLAIKNRKASRYSSQITP